MTELVALMNKYNLKITEVQKIVVSTITAEGKGRILISPAVRHLEQLYAEALSDLTATEATLKAATQAVVHPDASQSPAGPTLSPAPAAARAPAEATNPLDELTALTRVLAANTIPNAVAARNGPEAGAKSFEQLAVVGPTLAKGRDARQSSQAELAILRDASLPVTVDPNSPSQQKKREDELKRTEILRLAREFLVDATFSKMVLPSGTGLYEPTFSKNRYEQDIGTLTYDRLASWPEGFYQNGTTTAFQYLAKLDQLIAIFDFGSILDPRTEVSQRGIEIIIKNSPDKKRWPIVLFENDFLVANIKQLSAHFGAILEDQYGHRGDSV